MFQDLLYGLLFGKMTTLNEAREKLSAHGIDSSLLDTNDANHPLRNANENPRLETNPYASPESTLRSEVTRTYFRGFTIQELPTGDTIISGRLITENPIAYRKEGLWKPQVLFSERFKRRVIRE